MKLANHPNVISTPHIGASTLEAQVRCGQDIAEKIVKFVYNMTSFFVILSNFNIQFIIFSRKQIKF